MAVPTTLVIDATQQTLEVTTSRDAVSIQGRSIETGVPTDGEVLTYSSSASEWVYLSVDENVDDRVAALIQDSAGGGLTWTYDDSAGTLTPAYVGDSTLVTTGAVNSGSITSGFTSIDVGSGAITTTGTVSATTLAGTLSTAAQTNVTSLGTLVDVTVTNDLAVDTDTLFVDASEDRVGVNQGTPLAALHVEGANDVGGLIVSSSLASISNHTGIEFGYESTRKGAIFFQRTTSFYRGTLNFCVQNTADTTGVAITDVALRINADGSTDVTGALGAAAITATTIAASTSLALATGATVTGIDNGGVATGSATLLATQGAIKTYVDAQVTAQDLDIISDSGNIDIDLDSESLTLAGGTGLDSSASSTTVTFAIDSTVATLAGSQTLTNKSIAGSANTLSAIANSSLTNSTVAYGGVSLSLGGADTTPAFNLSDATAYTGDSSLVTVGTISSGTWNGSVITGAYIDATSSPLASTKVWIGSASNVAAEFALSGNATMTAGGVVTVSTAAACSGLAATATALATARAINGTDFDGTAAITVTAAASTLTGTELKSTVVTSSLTSVGTIGTGVWNGTAITGAYIDPTSSPLASTKIWIGSGSNVAAEFALSGDATMTAGGAVTVSTAAACTGNAATATALQTARTIGGTSFDGTADIAVGLSATATALATARAINGTDFDGTAAITVTAAAGTVTGATLNSGVTASSLTSLGTLASLTTGAGTVNLGEATNAFSTEVVIRDADGAGGLSITDNAGTPKVLMLWATHGGYPTIGSRSNDGFKILTNDTTALTFDTSQNATFAGNLVVAAMSTSDPSSAGQLWNDSGTVKISSG